MQKYTLAPAMHSDLSAILDIYNGTIASRRVTADLQPVSLAERESWFQAHQRPNRPLLVVKDRAGSLKAWCSLSDYYPRAAYNRTAEISLYVHPNHRHTGIAAWLLPQIFALAPQLGIRKLIAVVFAHNIPSVRLFHRFGFEDWGTLPQVCDLDGQLADIVLLGKSL